MKIAIVHDYLNQYGGAERVLEVIHQIWPEAPIFTSLIDYQKMEKQGFNFKGKDIRTSFMQKLPFRKSLANSYYLPLYPLAFEKFDLTGFDVVLSVTSFAAKGVITKPETTHICYCCTPTRHLWHSQEYLSHHSHVKGIHKPLLYPILNYLRIWDLVAASRVDYFLTISKAVQRRLKRIYHREAEVIYPPVNLTRFLKLKLLKTDSKKGFFLIVSRLGGHKRVDLAIEAFNRLKLPLKIIGDGPQEKRYRKMAGQNIEILGRLPDERVDYFYQNCLGFIYPQEEDFGITALEAQAAGKPVIAFKKGGALETIIEGQTGIFFEQQTVPDLTAAINQFHRLNFNPEKCRAQARNFSEEKFRQAIKSSVEKLYDQRQRKSG
ncbi:glycosyltransferase family 4 protein [candidate division WWE3 bacterium CG_4_8_14_3_um_filter_42_11]|uniref:Glycosyltransferase family 4 protein n=1 Tax=candidate division WWE3 bacterium CG_4_8_14_3_um_filter_42_11 TaxID=1975076 RepID=A0A2M8G852_UNCKA|nr:MAG: glycosyltransferase family 4 protein [candidate division WWE3 bacterium CG_4_8_14_3_um_filter_42_11]